MIVLSIGGSLLNPGKPDLVFVRNISRLLSRVSKRHRLAVVTGGGAPARDYANAVRGAGGSEFNADQAAILSTRQNALVLVSALGEVAYPSVVLDFDEAVKASVTHRVIVMGGTIPGITTDTDAALLAEQLHAERLVNLSNIDAIYSADPRREKEARRYASLSFEKLVEIASASDKRRAGENFVFDILACKVVARSKIETHFVHGRDLEDVEKAIDGEKHMGTIVK